MSASPKSASSSGGVSDTSTLVYEQEPFETYITRVKALVKTIHPSLNQDDIDVERMRGGGFNRIIGYSFKNTQGDQEDYVLRIPRYEYTQLVHDLTPLLFLRNQSDIPVPQVITFDVTSHNELGQPYMIQRRIPGARVLELFPTLDHPQRLQVARRIGHAVRFLTSVQGHKLGRLTCAPEIEGSLPSMMLEPLEDNGADAPEPYRSEAANKPMSQLLTEILQYRNTQSLAGGPTEEWRSEEWDKYSAMVKELDDLGYLTDVDVTLCHLDFEPRNILVNTTVPPADVSAFLDWDSAVFAPSFMACTPPSWIWAWKEGEEEDELKANETPDDPQNRELKIAFEEAAGPVYARYAYEPAYRLARRLVQRIFFGLRYSQDFHDSESMLIEWAKLKDEKMKGVQEEIDRAG